MKMTGIEAGFGACVVIAVVFFTIWLASKTFPPNGDTANYSPVAGQVSHSAAGFVNGSGF